MTDEHKKMTTVYYDGACPQCVKDRSNFERLSGDAGKNIIWFDITDQDAHLRKLGIDPQKALLALHVRTEDEQILSEVDAYILLLRKVPFLRPLAWLIGLPVIRPVLSRIYRRQVDQRLRRSGRL